MFLKKNKRRRPKKNRVLYNLKKRQKYGFGLAARRRSVLMTTATSIGVRVRITSEQTRFGVGPRPPLVTLMAGHYRLSGYHDESALFVFGYPNEKCTETSRRTRPVRLKTNLHKSFSTHWQRLIYKNTSSPIMVSVCHACDISTDMDPSF